jgi:alpha-ribazole phosphatase/probable phosphoglycerate mutase
MKTATLRLYLVRHGITDWNQAMRMQGHSDIPLNDEGRGQAKRIAARLASLDLPIEAIWSSDLSRARQTAETIAAPFDLPVKVTPLLREIMLGDWEGLNQEEIEARGDGELLRQYRGSPAGARPPGGETLAQTWERMMQARSEIGEAHPEGNIVVVGHGGSLRALLCAALDAPVASMIRFSLENASLSVLEQTRTSESCIWRVRCVNDTAHLKC